MAIVLAGIGVSVWMASTQSIALRSFVVNLIAFLLFIGILAVNMFACFRASAAVKWPSAKDWTRWRRRVQRLYKVSPGVRFLHLVSICLVLVSVLVWHLTQGGILWTIGSICSALLIALSAPLDWYQRTAWLMRWSWIKWMATACLAALGTVTFFLASAAAKDFVTSLTGVEAAILPQSVAVATTLMYPLALVLVVTVVAVTVLILELLVLACLGLGGVVTQMVLSSGKTNEEQPRWLRFLTGRRRFGYRTRSEAMTRFLTPICRVFAPLLLVAIVGLPITSFYDAAPGVAGKLLRIAIVRLDFKPNLNCVNLPQGLRVVAIDTSRVVVVRGDVVRGAVFAKESCRLD
jgi:hypothetical protein